MIEKLREMGLNKYESNAYLALIKIGISTSTKISTESNVPYGRIYTVLQSLEKKGFAKIFDGRPKRFMAVEPRVILNKVLDKKKRELDEKRDETNKIIKELEALAKVKLESPLEMIRIIEGRKNYLNFSIKLHEKSKKEWRSIHRLPIYQPHLNAYKKMVKRGVKTRILTQIDKEGLDVWKKTGAKIRYLDKIDVRFTVIDKEEVVLRLGDPETGGWIAIWIKSSALAATMAENFDKLWKNAKRI
jgi:sugar-specific transcriptional regulator TrmB